MFYQYIYDYLSLKALSQSSLSTCGADGKFYDQRSINHSLLFIIYIHMIIYFANFPKIYKFYYKIIYIVKSSFV